MKTLLSQKYSRIIQGKKKLEQVLKIKITNRGKELTINGKPEDEFVAEKVIDAINFGFKISDALTIKTQGNYFETLNIKNYSKSSNLERVRSRLIGKNGRCINTLRNLSNCFIDLNENKIGIIGPPEFIQITNQSIIQILQGTKQSHAYAFLEKHQPKPIQDLGLKEEENNL